MFLRFFVVFLLCHSVAHAKTYPIVEPDPMVEIQKRLESVDVTNYTQTPREEWTVFDGDPYPKAMQNRTRIYIPMYSLEFDIFDKNGKVLYPKGFTFNPLEYVRMSGRIVVFHLDKLEELKPLLRTSDILIADAGDVIAASEKLGRHIFLVEPKMRERLGLKVVPSIITQKENAFEIQEIADVH